MAWEKLGTASVSGTTANTSWKELARGTGSGGTTIDSGTFTAKDNIMVLGHITQGRVYLTYNNSTGNEYANRRNEEGGSDTTQTSQDKLSMSRNLGEDVFFVGETVNITNQEKLGIYHAASQNSAGAGNAPKRQEWVTKYVPSSLSTNITSVKISTDSGTYDSNDQIVVLGYDNDEADSGTNFWQELASVSGDSTALSTGTFAAKKYLMVDIYVPSFDGSVGKLRTRFNSDSGSNYHMRISENGGADTTEGATSSCRLSHDSNTSHKATIFIVNKSDKEKLFISHSVSMGSSGAGTATERTEIVGKWANTSAQITSIDGLGIGTDGVNDAIMKVYGAD